MPPGPFRPLRPSANPKASAATEHVFTVIWKRKGQKIWTGDGSLAISRGRAKLRDSDSRQELTTHPCPQIPRPGQEMSMYSHIVSIVGTSSDEVTAALATTPTQRSFKPLHPMSRHATPPLSEPKSPIATRPTCRNCTIHDRNCTAAGTGACQQCLLLR
ncbi:hypothetical protein BDV96DRAFT_357452 [Lophiotrema nucula]|uniref:Uncharacterized protein n=1 Tax=Lophiotrema nucula TaxID=690887 RepID=A0A6A5YF25_9PLEO|nr:hypothetical protein BDV96DRAFT_357452 [Lophiotrema nucula]